MREGGFRLVSFGALFVSFVKIYFVSVSDSLIHKYLNLPDSVSVEPFETDSIPESWLEGYSLSKMIMVDSPKWLSPPAG